MKLPANHLISRIPTILALAVLLIMVQACGKEKDELASRSQHLEPFNPHRKQFTCKRQDDAVPPIDVEADALNTEAVFLSEKGLALTHKDLVEAERLWIKASGLKHWQAFVSLSDMYATRHDLPALLDFPAKPELAVKTAEDAMKLGIPAGYLLMGDYYKSGIGGLNRDYDRTWAFWQRAADMGSPDAQTVLGISLSAAADNPDASEWANRTIGIQMLECAVSQQLSDAGFQLGLVLLDQKTSTPAEQARALAVMQDAVKLGSDKAARYLFSAFDVGDLVNNGAIDADRSLRYKLLARMLTNRKEFRLPNLDRILPLPPSELPSWDGKAASLLDVARPDK